MGRWGRKVSLRFLVIAGMCIVGVVFAMSYLDLVRSSRQLRALRAEIRAWQRTNELLKEDIEYVASDEYVEKIAREKLGLVKPGEIPIVVTTPSQDEIPPVTRRPGADPKRILD